MINYFGLGEDAKIGLLFERMRTNNRVCNKAAYGVAGVYYWVCCNRGLSAYDVVESIQI